MNESITGYEQKEMDKENPDYKALYEFKAKRCDNFARRLDYIHLCANEGETADPRLLHHMAYGSFTSGDKETYKNSRAIRVALGV